MRRQGVDWRTGRGLCLLVLLLAAAACARQPSVTYCEAAREYERRFGRATAAQPTSFRGVAQTWEPVAEQMQVMAAVAPDEVRPDWERLLEREGGPSAARTATVNRVHAHADRACGTDTAGIADGLAASEAARLRD